MSTSRARLPQIAMLTFLLAGCSCGGDDSSDSGTDASEDVARDAADTSVAEDAAEDTSVADDAAEDAAEDTAVDVTEDALEDTLEDTADDTDGADSGSGAACPDYVPPPPVFPPCTDALGCDEICFPPGVANCGPCQGDTCASDSDCAEGDLCVDLLAACACSGSGVVTGCLPDCSDAPCPGDEYECIARPGGSACVLASCTGSYECGFNQVCDADDGSADVHGCVRRLCATDADCECGSCVGSRCYSGPGTCQPPAP